MAHEKVIKEVQGNLFANIDRIVGDVVLLAETNCFNILDTTTVRAIKGKYPEVDTMNKATPKGDELKLGTYTSIKIEHRDLEVKLMYTRFRKGKSDSKYSMPALLRCLEGISKEYKGKDVTFITTNLGVADTSTIELMTEWFPKHNTIIVIPKKKKK